MVNPASYSYGEELERRDKLVSFEWIGLGNYLREKMRKNGRRTRGANFPAANAAVKFERDDGRVQCEN